jgi:hypothetical protein
MAPVEKALADKRFLEHLKRSRAGRIFQAHLAGMHLRNETGGRDNSMQEAIDNERIFIKTMGMCLDRGKPFPCGLPTPLPKFIAILNLSGERMLVYSNSCSLIRLLCTRSTQLTPSELVTQVDTFAAHVNLSQQGDKGLPPPFTKFVLLSLSLPWQAGAGALFWSLSACRYNTIPDPRIVLDDRAFTLTSHSTRAFVGKPVLDRTDHAIPIDNLRDMPLVTSDQVKDFTNDYACVCLDPSSPESGATDGALGGEGGDAQSRAREETLRGLIAVLREQATKDKERYDALQNDFDDATAANLGIIATTEMQRREESQKHADAIKEVRRERDELEAQITSARDQCDALRREHTRDKKAHTKLQERFEQFKRQSESKDTLANSTSAKAAMQLRALEDKLAAAQRSLASAKQDAAKEREKALEKLQAKHDAEVERMQTRLEGKKRIIDQLSENNEGRNAELASLKAREAEQDAELTRWRQASADAIEAVNAANGASDDARAASEQLAAAQEQLALLKIARRSVGVSTDTDTKSTETHRCATTQTDHEKPAAPAPTAPAETPADASADSAPSNEANAPTAVTGTPKGTEVTYGSLSGEVSRQATEALQRLINHLCIVEHQPLPMPIYFQYPPAGFDPMLSQATYMGPPMMQQAQSQPQFSPAMQLPPQMMQAPPQAMGHPGGPPHGLGAPFRQANGPGRPGKYHRPSQGAPHHGPSISKH